MKWFKRKDQAASDETLLAQARDGDLGATGNLFNRYVDLLFGVALKYHQDASTAEDAVMEIFEKYQKKIQTQDIQAFRPWLYVLAKNHCLEQLRKRKNIALKKEQYNFMQLEDVYHPYVEDVRENQLQSLENCIKKLKEEQRQMIQLFYLEQRSYKEISEKLSINWEKVRSHIQNGRRNLKKCLEANV